MALIYQFKEQWIYKAHQDESIFNFPQLIIDSFDAVYPPDGVDPLNETLNGSKEEFKSDEGKKFRTHFLTRLTSFIGLPNRKLRKDSGQSVQNLDDNFISKQENASTARNLIRALITPLNIIMVPLKLAFNLLKLITEFVPGSLFKILSVSCARLMRSIGSHDNAGVTPPSYLKISIGYILFTFILFPTAIAIGTLYFSGCCLTSSFDTMKSAWRMGCDFSEMRYLKYKQLAYLFVAISIIGTLCMLLWATPLALKAFAITAAPVIAHSLPPMIMNFINKIGAAISPTLTAIGHALAKFCAEAPLFIQVYYAFPVMHIFPTMPALVGAGLFIATTITALGPLTSSYINNFKEWWNFNPDFEENDRINSSDLSQQCKMLCALKEPVETLPIAVMHESPQIIEKHVHTNDAQLDLNNNSGSLVNLTPPQNRPATISSPTGDITISAKGTGSNLITTDDHAASSSLFPPSPSLKPPAAEGFPRANAVIQYDTHPVRKP